MDALRRCLEQSAEIASFAVIVDAKDEGAKLFYKKFGFLQLPDHKMRLYLPMTAIARLFGG